MLQPQPIQVRRAPRKLPIEIGGLGKNGILTSFVYMPAEELQLSDSPCGKNTKKQTSWEKPFMYPWNLENYMNKMTVFDLPY